MTTPNDTQGGLPEQGGIPEEFVREINLAAEYLKYPDLKIPFRSGAEWAYHRLSRVSTEGMRWMRMVDQLPPEGLEVVVRRVDGNKMRHVVERAGVKLLDDCLGVYAYTTDPDIEWLCESSSTSSPIYTEGWIRVVDRNPNKDTDQVLLWFDGMYGMDTGYFIKGKWCRSDKTLWWILPTHWQPLPQPPKGA